VDHREQARADARGAIARVQQVVDATVVVEVREAREHAVGEEAVRNSARMRTASAAKRAACSGRFARRYAPASAVSVCTCSVTVHALHRRSRIFGSTGWSESFQSPWP
jgi:hypothetical protein